MNVSPLLKGVHLNAEVLIVGAERDVICLHVAVRVVCLLMAMVPVCIHMRENTQYGQVVLRADRVEEQESKQELPRVEGVTERQ